MPTEADFYSPGEAAGVLGVSERQIFGMLVSGELEGQQDELARWRIPVSAIRRARPVPEPSSDASEEGAGAASEETSGDDATTVSIGPSPPWGLLGATEGEETTQEAGGATIPSGDEPAIPAESGGEEATRRLPRGEHRGPLAPDAASDEAGLVGELQTRLERAEHARSRLEEEVRRLGEENKRLREELGTERDKGVFGKLFRE